MAAEIAVVPATMAHALAMAPKMRAADAAEVLASGGRTPAEALRLSLAGSVKAWAGLVGGEPACLFGVNPVSLVRGIGSPWLLGTDLIERHQMAFLRRNRRRVQDMQDVFPRLCNRVDARNVTSIRWLTWLGFAIHPAEPFGPFGLPFHLFTMERRRCARP